MTIERSVHVPFLSICITSYNRVNELYRCLKSIDTVHSGLIEIIVSEDCSPRREQIAQVVKRFALETDYKVVYNTNVTNLGYDRNLGKLIELATGDYILLMSDDDAFCKTALDKIIKALTGIECGVAFCPFIHDRTDTLDRVFKRTASIGRGIETVKKYWYCAILFSGLIFRRNLVSVYSAEKFKNLIYFQVYLFASVLLKNNGYYIDVPLVRCINDGENAFGLSDSSEKNALLADRKSIYSNLEYHKGLIQVVKLFDEENGTDLMKSFAKEYSLRAYGGMAKAREGGRGQFVDYCDKIKALDIKLSFTVTLYYWALNLLGVAVCNTVFEIPKKLLLNIRRRYSK